MRVYPFIRTTKKHGIVLLRFRLKDGNKFERWFTSDIPVDISMFDNRKGTYKVPRLKTDTVQAEEYKKILERKEELDKRISTVKDAINSIYLTCGHNIRKDDFATLVDKQLNPEKYQIGIFEQFEVYANKTPKRGGVRSEAYKKSFRQCRLHLERFEAWKQTKNSGYKLSFKNFTKQAAEDFYNFLMNEDKNFDKDGRFLPEYQNSRYAELFTKYRRRGARLKEHTINKTMLILKIVFNDKFGKSGKNPIKDYVLPVNRLESYADPFFLYASERDIIAAHDFGSDTSNAYRDAFVFQCLTGERVSDLKAFTVSSIQGGMLCYVPIKTQGETKHAIRVPLNEKAKSIATKWSNGKNADDRLFPFLNTEGIYNRHIRLLLTSRLKDPYITHLCNVGVFFVPICKR